MQTDIHAVRAIVIRVSYLPASQSWQACGLGSYSFSSIIQNLEAVFGEALVTGKVSRSGKLALVYGLTPLGREFCELVREDAKWSTLTHQICSNGLPMTLASALSILGLKGNESPNRAK